MYLIIFEVETGKIELKKIEVETGKIEIKKKSKLKLEKLK